MTMGNGVSSVETTRMDRGSAEQAREATVVAVTRQEDVDDKDVRDDDRDG